VEGLDPAPGAGGDYELIGLRSRSRARRAREGHLRKSMGKASVSRTHSLPARRIRPISAFSGTERWFPEKAAPYNFSYDTTSIAQLNSDFLSGMTSWCFWIRVRRLHSELRFRRTWSMRRWMGFILPVLLLTLQRTGQLDGITHISRLGSYVSNTWRPTSAILRVETKIG